jgi:hypothetical protein
MHKLKQLPFVALIHLLMLGAFSTASAQSSDGTQWSITPYIWASATTVDLTFRDTNIGAGDISFGDLLDVLDAAFMLHVESGGDNWSAFGDFTYLKTSDTTERTLITIDADNEQTFLDAAVAYWPGGVGSQFNVFGGLRYTGFNDRYRFSIGGMQVSEQRSTRDYYDALLGVRYRFDLAERWELLTHGDFSFGDSEGTFLLRANFGYIVGKRRQNRILFGYQYKEAEFKNGDLIMDFSYTGPMAGFNFRF